MKKIFPLVCILWAFALNVQAQDKAEEAFLKGFPDLAVGKTIGEKECKAALKKQIKSDIIGKIDYKKLLYSNATDVSKWVIMPLGKYKLADGVYYMMYFSAYSGLNHTSTDCSYMLNLAVLDFKQDLRVGENLGNDGEYILMSKDRQKSVQETIGKDTPLQIKAYFTFTLDSPTQGTLKSTWEYAKESPKNTTFRVKMSSTSFGIE